MEANAAGPNHRISRDNSNCLADDGDAVTENRVSMQKCDMEDSVFEEDPQKPQVSPIPQETSFPTLELSSSSASVVFPSLPNSRLKELDLHVDDVQFK